MTRVREIEEENSFSLSLSRLMSSKLSMKEDENLGVNTRLASSLERERIVLASFFLSRFSSHLRFWKRKSTEKHRETTRERE